jgi:hypothetical protein
MDFKPGDFLVGLIDFFAVLLPGAILAFAFKQEIMARVFNDSVFPAPDDQASRWAVFILGSYLLGHFVFWMGGLLDGSLYRWYQKRFLNKPGNHAYEHAREIKTSQINHDSRVEVVNTFQWSKAVVQLLYPAAAGEIHRFEATSKFFRSLIVVLILICVRFLSRCALTEFYVCLGVAAISFIIYADQRNKSTNLAYAYLIALKRMGKLEKGE